MRIAFFGSSLVSAYWNGAATYYRGIVRALARRGHRITFYEPDAYDRQQHRDIADPDWARGRGLRRRGRGRALSALEPPRAAPTSSSRRAASASSTRCSRRRCSICGGRERSSCSGTSTRPRRSTRLAPRPRRPARARSIPRYDLVLTYGGGDAGRARVPGARARAGACRSTTRSIRRRTTRSPPDPRFDADLAFLGNRLPDREARVAEFFLARRARGPERRFLLGGAAGTTSHVPAQRPLRRARVHARPQRVQRHAARLVLNVSRESMARYGFSPATRVFEAAGAGACIVTDAWEGIDAVPRARSRGARGDGRRGSCGVRARGVGARGTGDRAGGAPPRARRAHLRPPRGPARGRAGGPGAPGRRATGGGRVSAIATAGHEPSRLRVVILGLTITSSWGNGHATTYRGLVRELAALGHDVLFLERDEPWYAENRDLPEPPYGRTRLYRSVAGAALAVRGRRAAGRPGGRRLLRAGGDRRRQNGSPPPRAGATAFYDIDTPVTLARLARGEADYVSPSLIRRYSTVPVLHRRSDARAHREPLRRGPRLAALLLVRRRPSISRSRRRRVAGTWVTSAPTATTASRCSTSCCSSRRAVGRGAASWSPVPQFPDSIAWPENVAPHRRTSRPRGIGGSTRRSASRST